MHQRRIRPCRKHDKQHSHDTSLRRALQALRHLFVLTLLLPGLGFAQSQTLPAEAGAWNEHLEIGPVAGLTTTWHPAPRFTGAPRGETLQLRIRAPRSSRVAWSGAREVERTAAYSVAEVPLVLLTGPLAVTVSVESARGELIEEGVVLDVRDTGLQPVQVTAIRVTASSVEIDPGNPNASTMRYYFQGSSIAALRELAPNHYLTSIDRWLAFEAEVEPAVFAPLVEWRLDGEPQRFLGGAVRMRVFTARTHTVEAGPEADSAQVALETYLVRIISPRKGEPIPDGAPVTFTAVTDPAGYEDQITWLASTKYGSCDPLMGEGPEFTTVFSGTVGEEGRWLGARADNALLGNDAKRGSCTPLQALAAELLATHPTEEEIQAQQEPLQTFIFQGLDTLQRTAAGEICTPEAIKRAQREEEARKVGFQAGIDLLPPEELPEFRDCNLECLLLEGDCLFSKCHDILREPCLQAFECSLAFGYCEHRCIVSGIPVLR